MFTQQRCVCNKGDLEEAKDLSNQDNDEDEDDDDQEVEDDDDDDEEVCWTTMSSALAAVLKLASSSRALGMPSCKLARPPRRPY